MSMPRINIQAYLLKQSSEFPDEGPFSKLPLPTDALSIVEDPENWICFPENIVRIYLVNYENVKVIGVGDYEHPTVCSKVFESLDDACAWIAHRPQRLSQQYLEAEEFEFNPVKPIRIR